MAETIQVKRLAGKEDLAKLVAGDIVDLGRWGEKGLVYNYPNLKEDELFLICRLNTSWDLGDMKSKLDGTGVIFGNRDSFVVSENSGCLYFRGVATELPRTQDGLFHYGETNMAYDEKKGRFERNKKWLELQTALRGAGL